MQVVDVNGNMFGYDFLEVIGVNGKPKTLPFGITIGTTTIASGVVGRVLFQGAGNVVQESANLFWDNTNNRLGIGGTPGAFTLDVTGTTRIQGNTTIVGTNIPLSITGNGTSAFSMNSGNDVYFSFNSQSAVGRFYANPQGTVQNTYDRPTSVGFVGTLAGSDVWYGNMNPNGGAVKYNSSENGASHSHIWYYNFTERMRLISSGNLLIGTSTDAGFKLDVNGTARVQGQLSVGTSGTAGRINFARQSDGVTIGTMFTSGNLLVIDNASTSIELRPGSLSNAFSFLSSGNFVMSSTGALTDNASALCTMNSTTKGFLPPRMTTTQINAIASPAEGLTVYNTTISHMCFYQAGSWVKINHSPMY